MDSFPSFVKYGNNYVLYCHCYLESYPHVRQDTKRALNDDAQLEEGIYEVGTLNPSNRKKRRSNYFCKELSIVGFEKFTSVAPGKPQSTEYEEEVEG